MAGDKPLAIIYRDKLFTLGMNEISGGIDWVFFFGRIDSQGKH